MDPNSVLFYGAISRVMTAFE